MQFFFMHLGTLIGIITYFQVLERGHYTPEAVRSAAVIGLLVHSLYMAIAKWRGYVKQIDIGVWLLFALGAISAFAGIAPVVSLFQRYSPALLFTTLTLTAVIPLLLGRETFTYFYGRRNSPRWQQKLRLFDTINRLMTGVWTLIFAGAVALCLWEPTNPLYTVVFPNLLVLLSASLLSSGCRPST